jgi:hypothetical protein
MRYLFLLLLLLPIDARAATVIGDLGTGLVSCWDLDAASGTRNDAMGANNLTDNNTVTAASFKINNGADFERATSESLSIADASQVGLDITGDIAFSVWLQLESTNGNTIASKFGASGNRSWRLLQEDGGYYFTVLNSSDVSADAAWTALGVTTGTPYHVVVSCDTDASTCTLWTNNTDRGDKTLTGVADIKNSTAAFILGAGNSPNDNFYDGLMDVAAVWNRTLSDADVAVLYNSGNAIECGTAVAPFDDTYFEVTE